MKGRAIVWGHGRGDVLYLEEPLSFYGGVDPEQGIIVQDRHPQYGSSIAERVLLMERATGSTVGAYALLRLKENGKAPAAIVVQQSDPVLSTGAALANIPLVDRIDVKKLNNIKELEVSGDNVGIPGSFSKEEEIRRTTEEMVLLGGVIVKLGGSVITTKDSPEPKLNREVLLRLAQEIGRFHGMVAVVHGAGSFGHPLASKLMGRDLDERTLIDWARLQTLQYKLDVEVSQALHFAGVPAYPIQATSVGSVKEQVRCITEMARTLVEHGFVPLMYGTPAITPHGPTILSGDDLVYSLAKALGYRLVIHVSDVDGVYDRHPAKPGARLLDRVTSLDDFAPAEDGTTPDVTGSMKGKVEKALTAAPNGIVTRVVNGFVAGELLEALRGGEVGTRIG